MGVGSAAQIAWALIEAGLEDRVSNDIISRAQQRDQIIAQCRASRLMQTISKKSISNPAILFLTWPHGRPHTDMQLANIAPEALPPRHVTR